jgi:ligand-binding sensor domain-containing protein
MNRILLIIFFFASFSFFSQVGPRSWQDHLGLSYCNSITKFNGKIHASNYNSIVKIDEDDFSIEKLNKINGLNDVGISLLRANPNNNKLLVIYNNCNIDVINTADEIKNYSEIKSKILNGKKTINEVTFKDQFAYLACGFGIIVFDTEKLEVKETFIIGPNGSNLEVYQIALNDSLIFAATPNGLYRSNFKTKILNNFNNWTLVSSSDIPSGAVCGAVNVSGKIVAAYSPSKLTQDSALKDRLYVLNNNVWSKLFSAPNPITIRKLTYVNSNYFSLLDQFGVLVLDINNLSFKQYFTSVNGEPKYNALDTYFEVYKGSYSYWVADQFNGAFQTYGAYPYYPQQVVNSNGTHSNLISNIDIYDGEVATSPSAPDQGGGTGYVTEGINLYKDNDWNYVKPFDLSNAQIMDIDYVYFDRKDKSRVYASSWSAGLLEYKDKKLVAVYNASNSPMPEVYSGAPRCSGMCMDNDGNLWFANSDSKNFLSVKKKDGSFQTFTFDAGRFTRKIFVDKNNYIWALHERQGGITVFKHNNFSAPVQNVNYRILSKDVGYGNLESNSVYSIAEDKDGKIWIGTDAGIRVFYNPINIFSSSNFDAQPIKIVQDGNVELLLEKDVVTAIVVDGANNKWVGTRDGGLYCFSPDGLTQIYHFTKDNSPLYSNTIIDINYEKVTGDLYIGTDLGLQSFRSIIIEGDDKYNNVYAYPNPVKPNYQGTVFVRGLIDNSIVKIVDQAGNMVWETKSQGGQIEWSLKTLSGNRVSSGVYVVYATTTNGEQIAVSKILVIN